MKRMHIHIGVENLDKSIEFYTALFGTAPLKIEHDYAKWMLENPRVNFAISTRCGHGINHLGLQFDEEQELQRFRKDLQAADISLVDEGQTTCCYAQSEKSWVTDPSGVAWEAFQTMADARMFTHTDV